MLKRTPIILFLLVSALLGKEIVFGVVPQQSPLILSKKWIPVMQELSKRTGHTIVFKTERSIPQFEQALYGGKYDIAYMNPYHFIVAHSHLDFDAIARAKKNIQGIIVAPEGATAADLKTQHGERFLFPAPMAFAATLLVKYELKKEFGINTEKQFDVLYVNSHDSVYKGVARGVGSFGGGIVRTFNNLDDEATKKKLEILYRTKLYPSHPIAVRGEMPEALKESLQQEILELPEPLLHELGIKKMIAIGNDEYAAVKNLADELGLHQ